MNGREALDQLLAAELFPRESLDDLTRIVEHIDCETAAGRMTEDEADALIERHAERIATSRVETQGPLSHEQRTFACALTLALEADGVLS
jgi:hypothetical protein